MSLVAYRNLLRAARVAFQGDSHVLSAAQVQIRDGFRQNASMSPSEPQTTEAIQHANEVATFLRSNVVQGRKMQDKDDTYELRIHKDTERGDNESIKFAGSGTAGGGCGCK